MTLEELKKLTADDEGETVEVKETTEQRVDACETLCAFLDKDGGTVVFGVTKKGKLTGHRSYENRRQTIYLAIYDDRVEIKNPGKFPSDFNLARLFSPPIQHSEPRNEKIARVLYLRKSIETWGRGLTRIANECAKVGLPVPDVRQEYGCVTTVFRRPDWTGDNTPDMRIGIAATRTGIVSDRTGTGRGLSGTGWTLNSMAGTGSIGDFLARLPKLRKDARANVETVLHELIFDKNATIPQICARTGMALRTINNALATLRAAKIVLPREVAEKSDQGAEKVTEKRGEYTENPSEHTEKYTEKQTEKSGEYTENTAQSIADLTETEERIVAILRQNKFATQGGISAQLGITRTYITKIMGGLQSRKIIRRIGPDKGGYWEVLPQ